MSRKIIFILNLLPEELWGTEGDHFNLKILFCCSLMNHSFLNLYPTSQTSIISLKNGLLEQVSHFSGNKYHHNQGIFRMQKKNQPGKSNLKEAFFLAKKIFGKGQLNQEKEIIFFSVENPNFSFHFIGGFFIKNEIKFSAILLHQKIFIIEALTKLTKGFCKYIDSINLKDCLFPFKWEKIKKKKKFNKIFPLETSEFQFKFFFQFLNFKKRIIFKSKLISCCSNCGFTSKRKIIHCCPLCFFFEGKEMNVSFDMKKKETLNQYLINFKKNFSIFSQILIIDKLSNWGEKKEKIFKRINFLNTIRFLSYPSFLSLVLFNVWEKDEQKKRIFSTKSM